MYDQFAALSTKCSIHTPSERISLYHIVLSSELTLIINTVVVDMRHDDFNIQLGNFGRLVPFVRFCPFPLPLPAEPPLFSRVVVQLPRLFDEFSSREQ